MSDPVKKRLLDAYRACRAIELFTEDVSSTEYRESLLVRSAVERQLEIIGEALGKAAKEEERLEDEIPALPKIVALRNRVIHGYDQVDADLVWDITQENVPQLKQQLQDLLPDQ